MLELIEMLLPLLMMIESSNNSAAIGDGGLAVGILQIHKTYWQDGCEALGVNWPYSDAKDPVKSKKIAKAYLFRYGRAYERQTGKQATPEILARIHNGGPAGWKNKATQAYWAKVKSKL